MFQGTNTTTDGKSVYEKGCSATDCNINTGELECEDINNEKTKVRKRQCCFFYLSTCTVEPIDAVNMTRHQIIDLHCS